MQTRYAAGRVYNYVETVSHGLGGGRGFSGGADFAVGSQGSLYVIGKGTESRPFTGVGKSTLDHRFIWEDKGLDFAGGLSPWPTSIALDSEENVYISDDYSNRIFVYDKDGEPLGFWPEKEPVAPEPYSPSRLGFDLYMAKLRGGLDGDGEFNGPSGITFDEEDNLYVVDSHNHRVQVLTKDGKFLRKFGSFGTGEGELNLPWGIALDGPGNIYIADWGNHRVQKFSGEGEYLASFGRPGSEDGELRRPNSVAVDEQGDVYVVDWGNNRLNIYASDGEFLTAFYGDADKLPPAHQAQVDANPDIARGRQRADLSKEMPFARPTVVNVDSEGRIMVMESLRGRMQVYIKEKAWLEPQYNL